MAIAAAVGGGMMAAPAALAQPTIPVPCSTIALANAINFSPPDSILVLQSGCVYFIPAALPTVTRDLTIVGSNDTLRATGSGYTMLRNAADLAISNLTIAGGFNTTTGAAGAVLNLPSGDLSLTGVTFFDNEGNIGGAIQNLGDLTVASSTFTGNEATSGAIGGGAIDNGVGATTTISGTTFTGNEAEIGFGGAIESVGGTVTVQAPANTFTDNFADKQGGAIDSFLGTLSASRSTFSDNQADDDGGAVSNIGAVATFSQDGFTGNLAEEDGGAVATFSTTNLSSDTFSLNRADRRGGGLYVSGGVATLDTTTIFTNVAEGPGLSGGGIFRAGGLVVFNNNVIVRLNAPNNCTGLFCP